MTTELKVGDLVTVTHRSPEQHHLWVSPDMNSFIDNLCIIKEVNTKENITYYKVALLEDKHDWWWFHCSVVKKL